MKRDEYEQYENKIREYMTANSVLGEIKTFETSCHSVEDAVKTVGVEPDQFVKNICLVDNLDRLIIAIVLGNYKVSRRKVAKAMNIPMPEFASKEEVERKTGFPIGGVPPLGYEAIFLIDQRIIDKEFIYASAGSPYSLMKINPQELIKANNAQVYSISKK